MRLWALRKACRSTCVGLGRSTFDAHRLCHLAADRGRAEQMVEQVLRAYHADGLNVADPKVLRRLGGDAGLADAEVRAVLAGDDYAQDVRADRRHAVAHGVTGVPSLVINGGGPVSGIQPPSQLRRLLESGLNAPHGTPERASTLD
ncbi:DsbA family oxidoreductase [Micromonospora sp. DT201]|uniref:DsbA family oxidoreductase n=1 Tax=Micromonospora sp. DT201 TaxID=3393442 RepID=UPI003CF70531